MIVSLYGEYAQVISSNQGSGKEFYRVCRLTGPFADYETLWLMDACSVEIEA